MATNYIYNGDFALPVLTSNSYTGRTGLTSQFYWSYQWDVASNLINKTTSLNYVDPTIIGYTQLVGLSGVDSITQSFTITNNLSYILSFYYCQRTSYSLNNLQIYLNSVLIGTITTTPTAGTWGTYQITITPTLGVNTLKLLGQSNYIGITGVKIYTLSSLGSSVANYNSLKTSNVYGGLTVYDYLPTGGTLIPGSITTNQPLNYNYNGLPTYSTNSLGYIYSYATTVTNVAANTYINSGAYTLPIGVYIVDAYCRFTPSTSSTYILKLGISTTVSTITSFDYTILNVLTSSALTHNASYTYILTITSATTYYFIFIMSASCSSSILTGQFIRIA